jgi:GT2 family glycosyltransferase
MSTRNRADQVVPAVQSILVGNACERELIVIDQSTDDATAVALRDAGLLGHPAMRYHHVTSVGLSRGRNEGVRLARGAVVAFTDDDCVVPPGWAAEMGRRFVEQPDIAILFGQVVAPPRQAAGWIPVFHPLEEGFVDPSKDIIRSLGIGANFAVRRSACAHIGPFDEFMGAGSNFKSGEDTDYAYRAIRAGLGVYTTFEPSVVHHGLRTGSEVGATAAAYLRGMAAMAMKHARCGDSEMLDLLRRDVARRFCEGWTLLRFGRRPSGLGSRGVLGVLSGVLASYALEVNKPQRLYRARH